MIINVIQTQRQPKPEFTIENIVENVHMGEAIAHSYRSTYQTKTAMRLLCTKSLMKNIYQ